MLTIGATAINGFLEARLEHGDWDWAAIGSIATASAAIVTAVTVVFVFFQTKATAKAANEAKRSADAAFESLDYAQGQLKYAQAQHQQGLYTAMQTVKARLDANTPSLVTEGARVRTSPGEGFSEPLTAVRVADALNLSVSYTVSLHVRNDGPQSVKMSPSERITYRVDDEDEVSSRGSLTPRQFLTVRAGQKLVAWYHVIKPFDEWREMTLSSLERLSTDAESFTLRCNTDADEGVDQILRLTLRGKPMRPDEHDQGLWHFPSEDDEHSFYVHIDTLEREYYLSRSREQRLPEVEWESIGVISPQSNRAHPR